MELVQSREELREFITAQEGPVVVGFFGDFSDASKRARPEFEKFCEQHPDRPVALVDVAKVKGAHKDFGVKTVPTVILAEGERVVRKVLGFQKAETYSRSLLPGGGRRSGSGGKDTEKAHRVVVYVGEHCPWCRRVKAYLRRRGIRFTEIDVSKDQSAARTLVSRTGQTGVPQVDIDGQWVIGFDKARIDKLLGLRPEAA